MLNFDDVESVQLDFKIVVSNDGVSRLFWNGTVGNLPEALHRTMDVIVLVPSMEVIKNRHGYDVTDGEIPDEFHVKAVMDT